MHRYQLPVRWHGFLQSFDPRFKVFSAGTQPAERVNAQAVAVMLELEYLGWLIQEFAKPKMLFGGNSNYLDYLNLLLENLTAYDQDFNSTPDTKNR